MGHLLNILTQLNNIQADIALIKADIDALNTKIPQLIIDGSGYLEVKTH